MNFLFCLKTRELHRGTLFRAMIFSDIKCDFFRILVDLPLHPPKLQPRGLRDKDNLVDLVNNHKVPSEAKSQ